jgi:RNA polymerase sigma factor (sigma-70 family)
MSSTNRAVVFQQIDRLFRDGTLAGLGDGQLLERYLTRRDEAAFEALVDVHGPMVLGLCRRFLRDPRDIEDAFQATFLVLVRKAPEIRDRGLLSNWLYGVALRIATRARANLLRRRGREQAIGDAEFSANPESKDALGIGPVLDQELLRLPAKYRAPLVLCYLRGQTHDQAAALLRCPVGTVRSRMARGRDLLKRRLTRRGFAPTAALFGHGLDLPAHLLTEAVPAPLVAATVERALAIGSSQIVHATAAASSALALTQGVLTSMKLAQLKWIGLALLATGLSTGGAMVVASASARHPGETDGPVVSAVGLEGAGQQTPPSADTTSTVTSQSSKTTEERLRALEEQIERVNRLVGAADATRYPRTADNTPTIDRLESGVSFLVKAAERFSTLSDSTATTTSRPAAQTTATSRAGSPGNATKQSVYDLAAPKADSRTLTTRTDGPGTKIRELEAQLARAMVELQQAEALHRQATISQQEVNLYRSKVDQAMATLAGMNDDYAEELDQLTLEIRRKKAELNLAIGQQNSANALVARNTRLNEHKPGMVAVEDVAKSESELTSAEARVQVKQVELEESELRYRQIERRRARIQQILKATPETKGSPVVQPAAPAGK